MNSVVSNLLFDKDYNLVAVVDWEWSRVVPATEEEDDQGHNNEVVPRVKAFMEASKERQAFLERKIREQPEFFEVEKEHYNFKVPRRIVNRYP